MKIIILHPPLYPMNHALFEELGKYVELIVYCFGEHPRLHPNWLSSNYKKEAKNYEIRLLKKGISTFKNQFNFKAIYGLIKEKPDIVISIAFWIPSLYSSILKYILNFKFIIVTDAIYETDKHISKLKFLMRKFICNNSDTIISASDLTTEYIKILNSKSIIKKSLQTIDLKTWKLELSKLPEKIILKKDLNLPNNKIILLSVGAFIPLKNWASVFKELKEIENCIYILIGDGELKEKYTQYVKDNDLENKIFILPRKEGNELKKYFKLSDIFIFPSLKDTFGYVVPEALISGLPVICSEKAGASSLISNSKNGYVIDPNKSYKKEIHLTIKNCEKMKLHATDSISKYTIENKAIEYYTIFKGLIND